MVRYSNREDWELEMLLDSLRQSKVVRFRNLEHWNDVGWVENGFPVNPDPVKLEFQKIIGSILIEGNRHKVFIQPAMSHFADPLRQSIREWIGEADE